MEFLVFKQIEYNMPTHEVINGRLAGKQFHFVTVLNNAKTVSGQSLQTIINLNDLQITVSLWQEPNFPFGDGDIGQLPGKTVPPKQYLSNLCKP